MIVVSVWSHEASQESMVVELTNYRATVALLYVPECCLCTRGDARGLRLLKLWIVATVRSKFSVVVGSVRSKQAASEYKRTGHRYAVM